MSRVRARYSADAALCSRAVRHGKRCYVNFSFQNTEKVVRRPFWHTRRRARGAARRGPTGGGREQGAGARRAGPPNGTRRVQLVRRDGRDVSTLYGREGGAGGGGETYGPPNESGARKPETRTRRACAERACVAESEYGRATGRGNSRGGGEPSRGIRAPSCGAALAARPRRLET